MRAQASTRFTLVTLVLVGCGLASVLSGRPEIAALALPFVLVAGVALVQPDADLSVEVRLADERVLMGDTTVLAVELTSPLAGWAKVVLRRPAGIDTQQPSWAVALNPAEPTLVEFPLEAVTWGAVEIGELSVVFHDRHGFRQWQLDHRAGLRLRMHPPPDVLRTLIRPHLVNPRPGAHPSPQRAEGIEFAELRPYALGDPLRAISWRASARSEQLWVTDRHPERSADVVLFIDSYSHSGTDTAQALRWGVEASIVLARSHLAAGDRVGLIELGGLIRWVLPGLGTLQLQRLVDALLTTRLVATDVRKDVDVIPVRGLPPGAVVVALSPLTDETFVDHLADLRARGHDLLVLDTWTDDLIPAPASESNRLARRIWHAERSRTREQLARLGISVVALQPDEPLEVALTELLSLRRISLRNVR